MSTLRVTPLYGSYAHHPSYPSISPPPISTLIEYANIRILIDIGYDESLSCLSSFTNSKFTLPSNIDVILLCNSTLSSLGGLPYFFSKQNNTNTPIPQIYSTFPTAKMGQMTLYDTHANASLDGENLSWNLDDVDTIFSSPNFHTLKYSQSVTLHYQNKPSLTLTPHRSGHVVGSAFWILHQIRDETEVVVSPIYHHAREKHLDSYELLKFGSAADVLITRPGGPTGMLGKLYRPMEDKRHQRGRFSGGKKQAALSPPVVARAEGDLIESVMSALRRGGNVLIPVDASGRVLELVLVLSRHWEKHRLATAYNLCWVGPMTSNTIEYARSQLEWMADPLGEQFDSQRGHPYALKTVHILPSIPSLQNLLTTSKNPICVLASGSNLDNGPARDLLLKWADNSDNLIILTDYQQCGSLRRPKSDASTPTTPTTTILPTEDDDDNDDDVLSHTSMFSTSAQLLLKWCAAKSMGIEMPDVVNVDVLVPHRAPLAGNELEEFLKEEQTVRKQKREEEERRAMLREVELARGRLRLGVEEDEKKSEDVVVAEASSPPKKKTRFDSNLFLKFSKPLYMTFEVREEAVGIGQSDSVAKYGVNESVGREGEVLEDDYGIAVRPERFVDIVTGIDPSKYASGTGKIGGGGGAVGAGGEDGVWKNPGRGLGFGTDGRPVLNTVTPPTANAIPVRESTEQDDDDFAQDDEQALEAADLSEGKGIIRGRHGRPHIKVTTVPRRIEVLAEIDYVPLEGRVDARAARQSVRALQPRQVIILGGGKPSEWEKDWMDALKKSANAAMYNDEEDDDDDDEELWGMPDDDEEGTMVGETKSLADAVRELTLGGGKDDIDNGKGGSVFAPANQETLELNVGHAAYSVRLIDTPYLTKEEKEANAAAEQEGAEPPLPPIVTEPFEAKMGECMVSVLDYVATGQKVAADGSTVLAPKVHKEETIKHHRPNIMISDGDVLLTDLRSEVIAQGMKAEYSAHTGYQQLVVNNRIIVKKEQSTGKIHLEGPLCEDFFIVRSVVCAQYVTL